MKTTNMIIQSDLRFSFPRGDFTEQTGIAMGITTFPGRQRCLFPMLLRMDGCMHERFFGVLYMYSTVQPNIDF